ncbi:jg22757 [Pararge aegeria aegeria]|uniref:Jg22757 protein n=1 Tax=Pararge aegeria aegeria TaxID=348720 RepID=A0A8S4RQS6_9NEOP|nr:jg22757 [Pararge aegeria aegeria]
MTLLRVLWLEQRSALLEQWSPWVTVNAVTIISTYYRPLQGKGFLPPMRRDYGVDCRRIGPYWCCGIDEAEL